MQTDGLVRTLHRFVWCAGVGILVASIAALAIRSWMPESSHMALFILVHSLIFGVVLILLVRSVGKAKTDST